MPEALPDYSQHEIRPGFRAEWIVGPQYAEPAFEVLLRIGEYRFTIWEVRRLAEWITDTWPVATMPKP